MQNSCDLLIKNGSVVIPKVGITNTNIMIENGKIKDLSKSINNISYSKSIDATGKFILPGLIDPHVHYGVYTPIEHAAKTESKSAAIGGVTTMIRMLRLYSNYRNNIKKQIEASEKNHIIDFTIHCSILINQHLDDIPHLVHDIGINSFKVYMNLGSNLNNIHMDLNPMEEEIHSGKVEITDYFLEKIVKITSSFNSILLVHAEDPDICYTEIKKEIIDKDKNKNNKLTQENNENFIVPAGNQQQSIIGESIKKDNDFPSEKKLNNNNNNNNGIRHIKKDVSKREHKKENQILVETNLLKLWSRCRPSHSEVKSIKKMGELGRKYNSNIYFVHIGSSAAIDAIIHEKEQGRCNLYIETCPHYLTHTYEFNDTRGTDHVANKLSFKLNPNSDLLESLSGFPGIATMLPVLLSEGVNKGRIN